MQDKERKPNLSMLLAIKGLQPLEANSYSEVIDEKDGTVFIRRVYFYNDDWCRVFQVKRSDVPESAYVPDRTTPVSLAEINSLIYETYEKTSSKRVYSRTKHKWVNI